MKKAQVLHVAPWLGSVIAIVLSVIPGVGLPASTAALIMMILHIGGAVIGTAQAGTLSWSNIVPALGTIITYICSSVTAIGLAPATANMIIVALHSIGATIAYLQNGPAGGAPGTGTASLLTFGIILFVGGSTLAACSSATSNVTTAEAEAIGGPIVSGGVALVLRNNPTYIPAVETVASNLSTGNLTDLTTGGIETAIGAAASKAGIDSATTALIESAVETGLGSYLAAMGEATLASDPNGAAVVKFFASAVNTGAQIAQANPKAASLRRPAAP